jgi:hypothetical protein
MSTFIEEEGGAWASMRIRIGGGRSVLSLI